MPSSQEISASIYGAWRLALIDRSGMNWFNHTEEGFWHSFFAAILVAPVFALALAFHLLGSTTDDSVGHVVTTQAISYGLGWIVFPLAVLLVCRLMKLTDFFASYIIAFNWSHVVPAVLMVPIILPATLGLFPRGMAEFAIVAITFAAFAYRWFIARVALGANGLTAAALVILEVQITLLIDAGVRQVS